MAAQGRRNDPPLIERLLKEPGCFDFFQAVRLLERMEPARAHRSARTLFQSVRSSISGLRRQFASPLRKSWQSDPRATRRKTRPGLRRRMR